MFVKLILFYYGVLSMISIGMHLWDKSQAIRGGWRVREKTLHSFEFLGGWPGAILITRSINHKTAKSKYMRMLYAAAAVHVVGWMLLSWLATR